MKKYEKENTKDKLGQRRRGRRIKQESKDKRGDRREKNKDIRGEV